MQEQIDDHRHHQADHAHDEERSPARDVALGRVAPERQPREGDRRHEEGLHDRDAGEDQEDRADRQAHRRGEGIEEQLCARRRQAVDQRREGEDHHQRQEHDHPFQRRGVERVAEAGEIGVGADLIGGRDVRHRQARDRPGGAGGDHHGRGHQPVDLVHVGAKPLVDRKPPGAYAAGVDRFVVSHQSLQLRGLRIGASPPASRFEISGSGPAISSFSGCFSDILAEPVARHVPERPPGLAQGLMFAEADVAQKMRVELAQPPPMAPEREGKPQPREERKAARARAGVGGDEIHDEPFL